MWCQNASWWLGYLSNVKCHFKQDHLYEYWVNDYMIAWYVIHANCRYVPILIRKFISQKIFRPTLACAFLVSQEHRRLSTISTIAACRAFAEALQAPDLSAEACRHLSPVSLQVWNIRLSYDVRKSTIFIQFIKLLCCAPLPKWRGHAWAVPIKSISQRELWRLTGWKPL